MSDRPNILFVFADQMRGQAMGCAGNRQVITPNMDRLASEGVRMVNAISNCPLCVPARGSLITGKHALNHKAFSNDLPLPEEEIGIAEILKDHGYSTGYIGKWHLDGVPRNKFTPPGRRRHGFDYWAAWECHHDYFNGRYYTDTPHVKYIKGYEPDFQTNLAIDFMKKNADRSFCLFLSWGPPHAPYHLVPRKYKEMYDPEKIELRPNADSADREVIANYYAAITALDWNLGRLLKAVDDLGIANRTIVVFTSDHGDMLWSQGYQKKELPFEESIVIPFLIRWPGRIPGGRVCDTLFSIVDFAPTLLGLARIEKPEFMEGLDLSKAILGEPCDEPSSCFIYLPLPAQQAFAQGIDEWRGVRTKRYTYARWQDGRDWILFDNQQDPYQMRNLVGELDSENVIQEMRRELDSWLERTGDEFLPGLEHVRRLGLARLWNLSERLLSRRCPRWA